MIAGVVLPVATALHGLLLCLLSVDESDDDDHVPSMIVVGAPSKFPAVPSADAKGRGMMTAANTTTAQTPCDDNNDRFYATICYNPQLTSLGA